MRQEILHLSKLSSKIHNVFQMYTTRNMGHKQCYTNVYLFSFHHLNPWVNISADLKSHFYLSKQVSVSGQKPQCFIYCIASSSPTLQITWGIYSRNTYFSVKGEGRSSPREGVTQRCGR